MRTGASSLDSFRLRQRRSPGRRAGSTGRELRQAPHRPGRTGAHSQRGAPKLPTYSRGPRSCLLGGLAVDPLGGTVGWRNFEAEMRATIPTAVVGLGELERSAEAGAPDDGAMRERLALMWPGYLANPAAAHPCRP